MEWFLFPFLIVAVLAVWVSRQRRADPDDLGRAQRAHTAAEAKRDDWGGAAM